MSDSAKRIKRLLGSKRISNSGTVFCPNFDGGTILTTSAQTHDMPICCVALGLNRDGRIQTMSVKKYFAGVIVAIALFVVVGWPGYAQKKSTEKASALSEAGMAGDAGDEWLRFRGPNGSGVAEGAAVPADFGPTKNLRWKTLVPFARSSPVVTSDRIFLTASEGELHQPAVVSVVPSGVTVTNHALSPRTNTIRVSR